LSERSGFITNQLLTARGSHDTLYT
jgi:hypothetical protein